MLIHSGKANGHHCLVEYSKATHNCYQTKINEKRPYELCVLQATNDLEACSLEELIKDQDALHKYDVDNTAYMTLANVLAAQKEVRTLVKAADRTYQKQSNMRFGASKAAAFKKYKIQFLKEKKSVDHEVLITRKRIEIDMNAEEQSTNEEETKSQKDKRDKTGKKKGEKTEEKDKTDKESGKEGAECGLLDKEKKEIQKKLDQIQLTLEETDKLIASYEHQVNTQVNKLLADENLLAKLIKARKLQPKGRLTPGWKISCWLSRKSNGHFYSYDHFPYEKVKPDADFITQKYNKMGLQLHNHHQIRDLCKPHMKNIGKLEKSQSKRLHNRRSYDGHETHIRVVGTLVVRKSGNIFLHTNTDDGSYLYLGNDRSHRVINNGGMHGMRSRNYRMMAKKGQEIPFVFTFFEHHGHGAAFFRATDEMGYIPAMYVDNAMSEIPAPKKRDDLVTIMPVGKNKN